jgi:hypothetical protein
MEYIKKNSKDNSIKVFTRENEDYLFFFIVNNGPWEKDILERNEILVNKLAQDVMTQLDQNKKIVFPTLAEKALNETSYSGQKETILKTLLCDTLGLLYLNKKKGTCLYTPNPSSDVISNSLSIKHEKELWYLDDMLISIKPDIKINFPDSDFGKRTKIIARIFKLLILFAFCSFLFLQSIKIIKELCNDSHGDKGGTDNYQINLSISPEGKVKVTGTPSFTNDCMVEYIEIPDHGLTPDVGRIIENSTRYSFNIHPYLTRSCTIAIRVWKNNTSPTPWYYASYNHEQYIVSLWQKYSKLSYDERQSLVTPTDSAMFRLFDPEISYCYIRYNKTVIDKRSVFDVAQFVDNTPMVIDSVSYFTKKIPLFVTDIDELPKIKVVYCHPRL